MTCAGPLAEARRKDAFHCVPDFSAEDGDAVERVPGADWAFNRKTAWPIVPLPAKESRMRSPGLVAIWRMRSTKRLSLGVMNKSWEAPAIVT